MSARISPRLLTIPTNTLRLRLRFLPRFTSTFIPPITSHSIRYNPIKTRENHSLTRSSSLRSPCDLGYSHSSFLHTSTTNNNDNNNNNNMSDSEDFSEEYSDGSGSDFDVGGGGSSSTVKKQPAPKRKSKPTTTTTAAKRISNDAESITSITSHESSYSAGAPTTTTAKPAAKKGKKAIEDIYQKKTQLEHILLRPDTYIGSVEAQTKEMWVYENEKLVYRPVTYVPGLYKIFDEILVNAADNKSRDPNMDTLKVTINRETNTISVYNNGVGIPVQIHKVEGIYVPELIFGQLLTSSNYDDDEKKVTGGRNGYGAKLCNIFSESFTVETSNKESGDHSYKQTFTANMSKKTKPSITKAKTNDYTKITFKPDLAKFGMTTLDNDIVGVMQKRVLDMAGILRDVKVFLNDERIKKVRTFKDYVNMYLDASSNNDNGDEPSGGTNKPTVVYERVNDRWEVAFALSEGGFQQVSFVNSICTMDGGTHVKYVTDQVVEKVLDAVKKKNKSAVVKPHQVKEHMFLFINTLIDNPSFSSQTKETLTLKVSAYGSKCSLGEDFMKKVSRTGIVDHVLNFARAKQSAQLKKTDGSKKSRISGIAKLDDANNAGTRNAKTCTLILTEGDSAKALAVSGLSVVGRDNFGVFPLRGKMLNVREASIKQITENQEVQYLKKILGLQQNKVYHSVDELRYGHLMIMADQDHDGSHIKGLLINFFDHYWPSLLKLPGFLLEFITPIVKCTKGSREIAFYTLPEYEAWKRENNDGKGWHIKYYKGLGTSTAQDAKKYFSNMDRHMKSFQACDADDQKLIDMAFNKKRADDRKDWLKNFEPGTFMDHDQPTIPIKDFINKELILYSITDNMRSIPSVIDGLKTGQRKILFGCFKRNLIKEVKVAQLSGYVAEHSAYHHGEQSLSQTIIGLAQNYVGSNNINLLEPLGQFGTRLQGGKDHASPRYVFTMLAPMTRKLFHSSDDALLKYLNDDGQSIEPEWYLPIVPLVLINGAEGIGTGWSTSVPTFHPVDVVKNLMRRMNGENYEPMAPWFRGFTGNIEAEGETKFKLTGKITKLDATTLEVTELPIGSWTQTYKEFLEGLLAGTEKVAPFIRDYKEYHTDTSVHFVISLSEENMRKAEEEGFEKRFRMVTYKSTSNMVLFDAEGRLKKYANVDEIMDEFYDVRFRYYIQRKTWLADQLRKELNRLSNRVRFITEIIQGQLQIQNKKKVDVIDLLSRRGFTPNSKLGFSNDMDVDVSSEAEEDGVNEKEFDYLLSMPIWNLTMEKVQAMQKEQDDKTFELETLLAKSPKDLWKADLQMVLEEWDDILKLDQEAKSKARPTTKGKKGATLNVKKAAAKQKKLAKAKKVAVDDEDEDPISSSDDDFMELDDDYMEKPKKKNAKVSGTKAETPTLVSKRDTSSTKRSATKKKVESTIVLDDTTDDEDTKKDVFSFPSKTESSAFSKPLSIKSPASKPSTTNGITSTTGHSMFKKTFSTLRTSSDSISSGSKSSNSSGNVSRNPSVDDGLNSILGVLESDVSKAKKESTNSSVAQSPVKRVASSLDDSVNAEQKRRRLDVEAITAAATSAGASGSKPGAILSAYYERNLTNSTSVLDTANAKKEVKKKSAEVINLDSDDDDDDEELEKNKSIAKRPSSTRKASIKPKIIDESSESEDESETESDFGADTNGDEEEDEDDFVPEKKNSKKGKVVLSSDDD